MGESWVEFRFYEELNDYLPLEKRKRAFRLLFSGRPTIREAIDSLGVPPGEVDLILVDGESADLDLLLSGGERIAVYPTFERFDISTLTRLKDRPLRRPRFILAPGLGELARILHSHGFDALYRPDWDERTLLQISVREKRILLSTEGATPEVSRSHRIRAVRAQEQFREILSAFDLRRVPISSSRGRRPG